MPLECGHHVLSVPEWDPKWAQSNIYYTRVKVAFGDLMLGPSGLGSLRSHVRTDIQISKSGQICGQTDIFL